MRFSFKPWILILITVGTLFFLLGFGYIANAIYWHPQETPWTRTLVTRLPVPIGRVGGAFIAYADYVVQQDAARAFIASEAANPSPTADGQVLPTSLDAQANQAILNQLIRASAVEQLAEEESIQLTDDDVTHALDALVARAGTSTTPGEIDTYLRSTFDWTREDFKQRVIRPATLETAVRQEVYKNDDTAFQSALNEKTKHAKVYIRL